MRRNLAYAIYLFWHKYFVFWEMLKLGFSFKAAFLHDKSKFSKDEWDAYAENFYDERGKSRYLESHAFLRAWALHQKRNSHHWQYWLRFNNPLQTFLREMPALLVMDRGELITIDGVPMSLHEEGVGFMENRGLYAEPMDDESRREMLADWRGVGMHRQGRDDTLNYYIKFKDKIILHPDTRAWLEAQIGYSEKII